MVMCSVLELPFRSHLTISANTLISSTTLISFPSISNSSMKSICFPLLNTISLVFLKFNFVSLATAYWLVENSLLYTSESSYGRACPVLARNRSGWGLSGTEISFCFTLTASAIVTSSTYFRCILFAAMKCFLLVISPQHCSPGCQTKHHWSAPGIEATQAMYREVLPQVKILYSTLHP